MPDSCRILLVEDNDFDELQALRSITRSGLGAYVEVARDGEEACELLSSSREAFDLILLDIKLPKKNGFEVLQLARTLPLSENVPIVMLSSSAEPVDIQRALSLGANSYVQKPIDAEKYERALQTTLNYWLIVETRSGGTPTPEIEELYLDFTASRMQA